MSLARSVLAPSVLALVGFACSSADLGPAPAPVFEASEGSADVERWAEFLQKYLQVDTTNPPGNEARAFPLLSETLTELGLSSTVTPMQEQRGNIWARLEAPNPDPGARPLVLLHHIDVVPVEADKWSVPAFSGTRKDGRIYGRGAIDMKLVGTLQLAAIDALQEHRERLRRDVIFLAVSDEEVHGLGAQLAVEKHMEDWNPEYLLDEGGFAVRDFMNGFDILVIATTQKRPAKIKLTVQGEAGHGSRPIPQGGPRLLAEALHRIDANPTEARLLATNIHLFEVFGRIAPFPKSFFLSHITWPGMLWLVEGSLSANKNMNPMIRDTISPTILEGGQKANVIPAEASVIMDVRLLPDSEMDDVLDHIRLSVGDIPIEIEVVDPAGPTVPEAPAKGDPLFEALEAGVRSHEPSANVAPWTVVGANDSRFFAPRGVKTYGFVPVFLTKDQIDTIHGHDENVAVDELERGIVMYNDALFRFLLR